MTFSIFFALLAAVLFGVATFGNRERAGRVVAGGLFCYMLSVLANSGFLGLK